MPSASALSVETDLRSPSNAKDCTDAPDPGTLWLDVSVDGHVATFEFPPGNERAIAVGSLREADVHIEDARVAAVEFHFEREGRHIFVVPAYGADIEVNAILLRGPHPIRGRAIIAFAGRVIRVSVSDTPPKPRDFGNDTILTPFVFSDEAERAEDETTANLALRSAAANTTAFETPLAKQRRCVPSRPARLEFSELLALRAALRVPMPTRASQAVVLLAWVSAFVCGSLLGYLGAHAFPLPSARSPASCSELNAR